MVGSPAAEAIFIIYGSLLTQRFLFYRSWTQIPTFFWRFISYNVVVGNSIQDQRPVHRGEITEVRILLDPDGSPSDVPQVVQTNFLEVGHFKDDQRVVVEKVFAPNHREVRKEVTEGLQASHAEQQQIIGDHGEFGEAEVAKVLSLIDQQNLEISFHHCAALQLLQLLHTVAYVDVWPTNWGDKRVGFKMLQFMLLEMQA